MKKKLLRIFCLVMALSLLIGTCLTASAVEARASDYFWCTKALAAPQSDGVFVVEFDVSSTTTMKELGASKIVIYERQSDGSYKSVKTFTRYNTTGMIVTNKSCAYGKVSYSGTPDTNYYAIITFYAKDANGSETLSMATQTITA